MFAFDQLISRQENDSNIYNQCLAHYTDANSFFVLVRYGIHPNIVLRRSHWFVLIEFEYIYVYMIKFLFFQFMQSIYKVIVGIQIRRYVFRQIVIAEAKGSI